MLMPGWLPPTEPAHGPAAVSPLRYFPPPQAAPPGPPPPFGVLPPTLRWGEKRLAPLAGAPTGHLLPMTENRQQASPASLNPYYVPPRV